MHNGTKNGYTRLQRRFIGIQNRPRHLHLMTFVVHRPRRLGARRTQNLMIRQPVDHRFPGIPWYHSTDPYL